ncbi:MAG: glycosyl transferase [Sulfurimonas sp.]|nr:MAG: glycosyl transferase [Sulfurimonas sp.]
MELCMSPDLGGLELSMISTAKLLKKDFNVVNLIKKESKIATYFEDTEKVILLEKKSSFFMFLSAKKLAKIIDSMDIKIIHLHWTKDILFVVLAKILSKNKPKIVQTRHMTMTRFKNDFYHKFIYKNIDVILAVSQQVKEQLEKFIDKGVCPELELLYAGVGEQQILSPRDVVVLQNELSMRSLNFNIGMVGRINEDKGQHLLIQAVEILRKKGKNVNAYFVGHAMEVSYLEKLQAEVKEKKLQECIHFLGFMKDPHHFYQICDCIVLASKKETFGLVLLEAIQMKTAVIGSNSGGVVEIIDDKKNGLLFEVGNADDLADKILYMIENLDESEKMQAEALKKSQELFNDEKQYEKLKTIFERLV